MLNGPRQDRRSVMTRAVQVLITLKSFPSNQRTAKTGPKSWSVLLTSAEVGQQKEYNHDLASGPCSCQTAVVVRRVSLVLSHRGAWSPGRPLRTSPVSGTGRIRLPCPEFIQICIICRCVYQGSSRDPFMPLTLIDA